MTQPIHISLDLETWGTRPGCDIRSIGAVVFDPVTGYVAGGSDAPAVPIGAHGGITGTFYIATQSDAATRINLHRDPATVQWWSEQSEAAQAAFADPVDLREALERFADWLNRLGDDGETALPLVPDIRLWSHGPAFDPPILAAAYAAVGLPVPWHYRAPRDTRTAFDMAGIDDHSAWLAQHPGPLGIPHHALDDAICQARAVCGAYDRAMKICHQGDRWSAPNAS